MSSMPGWVETIVIVLSAIAMCVLAIPALYYLFAWMDYWWGGAFKY